MITREQSRAARALLDWTQDDLAEAAGLSGATVRAFERPWKANKPPSAGTLTAVQTALEKAGVEFIPENGGGAGVRLAKRKKK
jgi:transcriptional regulator with XRE-family HTH domain